MQVPQRRRRLDPDIGRYRRLSGVRHAHGTRTGTRLLTCFKQALLVLVSLRAKGDVEVVGAGFRVSWATAYHHRDEGVTQLAVQAPDPHERVPEVAAQGWSHVVLGEGTNRLVELLKRASSGLTNRSEYRQPVRSH